MEIEAGQAPRDLEDRFGREMLPRDIMPEAFRVQNSSTGSKGEGGNY